MKKLIIICLGIVILNSCNRNASSSESFIAEESSDTVITNPQPIEILRHEINYSDSIIIAKTRIKIDTLVTRIHCKDTIVSYRINPVTKKVIRLCEQRGDPYKVKYILTDQGKIEWDNQYGNPNEFIGPYLFSDIYRGGDYGGTITKIKSKIINNQLHYVDSIPGGSYSEGAGTWEWLISSTGEPETILFEGGDIWSVDKGRLLITPDGATQTFLIDLQKEDTLLSLPRPERDIRDQFILKDGILFTTQTEPRFDFLKMYDLNGELRWTAKTDYLQKILVIPDKNLIIGSGYYFPKEDNTKIYFTIAYSSQTGAVEWSFLTKNAFNPTLVLTDNTSLSTTNLFVIGEDLYGMIVEQSRYVENIGHNNNLILFNSEGHLYETIALSNKSQKYAVIPYRNMEFDIVSNYETIHSKLVSDKKNKSYNHDKK